MKKIINRASGRAMASLLPLAVALVLGGCSTGHERRQDASIGASTLNVATTALAGNEPELAMHVADAVLKNDPDSIDARLVRGDAAYLLGNCNSARADYSRVLHKVPHNAAAELGLGRCDLGKDPRSAGLHFAQATTDSPKNAVAFNDLGVAYAAQSKFTAATRAFRKALALDESLRAARVNLGMALALSGHPERAITILAPLVNSTSASPRIRADYATALVLAGHRDAAESILRKDMPATKARRMVARLAALTSVAGPTQQFN